MNEEVVPPGRFRSFIPGNEFELWRASPHHPKKTRPRRKSRGPESVTCRRTQPLCQGDDSRALGSLYQRRSSPPVAGGRAGRIDHAGHGSRRALHHRHEQLPHHVRRRTIRNSPLSTRWRKPSPHPTRRSSPSRPEKARCSPKKRSALSRSLTKAAWRDAAFEPGRFSHQLFTHSRAEGDDLIVEPLVDDASVRWADADLARIRKIALESPQKSGRAPRLPRRDEWEPWPSLSSCPRTSTPPCSKISDYLNAVLKQGPRETSKHRLFIMSRRRHHESRLRRRRRRTISKSSRPIVFVMIIVSHHHTPPALCCSAPCPSSSRSCSSS